MAKIMAPTTQQTLMPRLIVGRPAMTISVAQTECARLLKLLGEYGSKDPHGMCAPKSADDLFTDAGSQCAIIYLTYAGSPWQKEVQISLASVQASAGADEAGMLFNCLVNKGSAYVNLSADEVHVALAPLLPATTGAPPSSFAKAITPGVVSAEVSNDITAGGPALLPGEDCPTGYYRQDPAGPCEMLPPIPNGMIPPPGAIDPSEQACVEDGGTWDEANYNCILPTEGGECRIMGMKCSTAAIVGVAVVGGGLLLFMASKRRKRK